MHRLSVTIVAQDEQDRIARALESVRWADDVVVVDGGSHDRTPELARDLGARVISHPWEGYAHQKNVAVAHASNDWILGLDADEEVSEALADSIRAVLHDPDPFAGFACNRLNHYGQRPIRWGGWYPDRRVRLFDRRRGRWVGPDPHDLVCVDGPVGVLRGDLLHFSYRDPADHRRTIERLATAAATSMYVAGKRSHRWDTTLRPAGHFLKNYLLRLGILEGATGLRICAMGAFHVHRKYRLLAERWEDVDSGPGTADHRDP